MNTNNQRHHAILQSLAHRTRIERGLLSDFAAAPLAELGKIQSPVQIPQALYWLLLLGIVLTLGGIALPARADTGTQPAQTTAAVANDDFDNALVVTTLPYSNTQNIIEATTAIDDPVFTCTSGQQYNTVWYSYTPSISDTLIFSTNGSQYSTVLAVWTGARGSLTSQVCSTGAQVQLAVNAGTTYFICCWASTSGSGTWTASGPPLTPVWLLYLPSMLRNYGS